MEKDKKLKGGLTPFLQPGQDALEPFLLVLLLLALPFPLGSAPSERTRQTREEDRKRFGVGTGRGRRGRRGVFVRDDEGGVAAGGEG